MHVLFWIFSVSSKYYLSHEVVWSKFSPFVRSDWCGLTAWYLHGRWSWNVELRSESALPASCIIFWPPTIGFVFSCPSWLFLEQPDCNHLLAVLIYQGQYLWVSGPSCRYLWNVVQGVLLNSVSWSAHYTCLLVYHSFDVSEPTIRDDIDRGGEACPRSLLAHAQQCW